MPTKYVLEDGDEKKQEKEILRELESEEAQASSRKRKRKLTKAEFKKLRSRRRLMLVLAVVAALAFGAFMFLRWRAIPRDVGPTYAYEPGRGGVITVSEEVEINASGNIDHVRWMGNWELYAVAAEQVELGVDRRRVIPSRQGRVFWTPVKSNGDFHFRGLPQVPLSFFGFYDRKGDAIIGGFGPDDTLVPYENNPVAPNARSNMRMTLHESFTVLFSPARAPRIVAAGQRSVQGQVQCAGCNAGVLYVVGLPTLEAGEISLDRPFYVTVADEQGDFTLSVLPVDVTLYLYGYWDRNARGLDAGFDAHVDKITPFIGNPVNFYGDSEIENIVIKMF